MFCPALASSLLCWSDSLLMLFCLCHLSLAQMNKQQCCWGRETWCAVVELRWHERDAQDDKGVGKIHTGTKHPVPAAQQWIWLVRNSAGQVSLVCRLSTVLGGKWKSSWAWACSVHRSTRTRPAGALSWLRWTPELAAGRWFQSHCLFRYRARSSQRTQPTDRLHKLYLFYTHTYAL